ncbi:MAG: c-type cytochrome [Gemmataceae bacterium]|nr:c-type cytochrome [Gemmataceae bacterium]
MKLRLFILFAIVAAPFAFLDTAAQEKKPKKEVIPHAQDKPPGPPLSPLEAIKKMQVPPGFRVELVAAEPDIVNPVAMTFDERGRIWITESIEYPKRAAGPGKDRVKVLESTKGDGKFDKITTVIDGLNIPSGIAIGHGGVWVANSPDILFYPFEDFATAKLGKPQVVVTGFGRDDTHELPNSLTWGPDGWLYGLNGVFNKSVVKHKGKTHTFTCALFRIHPKTKDFEIFCEGTSNPWGLAFNDNGDAFVSACVIDHLWHLTETGYYHRQGGAYPPYTWKIGSIVKHKHQKAAYCGLVWFDSDAYPPEYREKMYMGNIHAGGINCDQLAKDGSTYFASPALSAKPQAAAKGVGDGSNFLLANDAWFMPVAQKVGPDGCMYILDWYDRYHCYQDANRDPAGIDRLKGRLYRVVYKDYKPPGNLNFRKESDDDLIKRLRDPNIYVRETAQRLLTERLSEERKDLNGIGEQLTTASLLTALALDARTIPNRMHALWSLVGSRRILLDPTLREKDPSTRAWLVRFVAGGGEIHNVETKEIIALTKDSSPDVQLQVAIAARKLKGVDPLPVLLDVLAHCGDDKLIPHIVWQNLHPLLEKDGERFLSLAGKVDLAKAPGLAKVLPRAFDRILGNPSGDPVVVVAFLEKLPTRGPTTASLCLNAISIKVQNGEIAGANLDKLKKALVPVLPRFLKGSPFADVALFLSATLGEDKGVEYAKVMFEVGPRERERLLALDALMTGRPAVLKESLPIVLREVEVDFPAYHGTVLTKLGKLSDPWVADTVLANYAKFNTDEQAKSIELLTQRPAWARSLFTQIADKKISKDVVNVNQARRLLATKDKELAKLIEKHWGIPRDGRNPEREKLAVQMKDLFKKTPGDAKAGAAHFKKICAQCHKMYGEGVDVGPDITSNGRADFDQMLSNLFDPSLVIGAGYQAVTVNTKQGQTLSGLIVEDNAQRVILKVQGGELKTIARKDVDEQFTSKLSMMPEDLEKQLRPQEIVDLLAYLSLDRPPGDPKSRKIPGTPR